jgi:hypothetical protein
MASTIRLRAVTMGSVFDFRVQRADLPKIISESTQIPQESLKQAS